MRPRIGVKIAGSNTTRRMNSTGESFWSTLANQSMEKRVFEFPCKDEHSPICMESDFNSISVEAESISDELRDVERRLSAVALIDPTIEESTATLMTTTTTMATTTTTMATTTPVSEIIEQPIRNDSKVLAFSSCHALQF